MLAPLQVRAQQVVATIPVGPHVFAMAVNSTTNKIYVVNNVPAGKLTVIDGVTNALTTVGVGNTPTAVAVNEENDKVYVANSADGTVTVIDGATNAVLATVATGINPSEIVVNQKNGHVYVLNSSLDGTETVIDGTTNAVVDQIFGGNNPIGMAVDPNIDTLYVIAEGNNNYPSQVSEAVYSAVGLVPLSPLNNGQDSLFLVFSNTPYTVAVNPVTGQVFTGNVNQAGASVINFANGFPTHTRTFGQGDYLSIAVNTKTDIAYAASSNFLSIDAINAQTFTDTQLQGGPSVIAVAVDEGTNFVYALNFQPSGTVTAINGQTNTSTTTSVGTNPFALAVNTQTHRVYVLNGDADGTVSVIAGPSPAAVPAFTAQPLTLTAATGSTVALAATANGSPLPTYQWTFNGTALSDGPNLSGSSTPTLVITNASSSSSGTYAVVANNGTGQATSLPAVLTVSSTALPSRIINLSTRARIASDFQINGTQFLIAGFVIQGGSKSLILRGVGPTLANFSVPGPIALPSISLYDSASPANLITTDTGWQLPPSAPGSAWSGKVSPVDATAADFAGVGAFALPTGSADSALKLALPAGSYTAQASSTNGQDGVLLAEIYDNDPSSSAARLVNVSSRSFVGNGINAMVAGFVVSGSTAQTVLIRASGPALAPLGVPSILLYPNVLLYDSNQNLIGSNSAWGGNSEIASAAARVGAFPWSDPASSDSALLVTLPPGTYTAEISPTVAPYGNALIEVYAVP